MKNDGPIKKWPSRVQTLIIVSLLITKELMRYDLSDQYDMAIRP